MSTFSKLFKLFLLVVFLPLVPLVLLLSYYQVHLKDNILETHVNLAEIVASSLNQHIEDLGWRLSFGQNVAVQLAKKQNPTSSLQDALAVNPDFLMLAILDKQGKELYRVGPAPLLKNIPTVDLSEDPELPQLATDRLSISSFDVVDGRPISEFIYPLPNGDYLYGILSFFSFLARLQEQRIGNTGRIYVVSQDGIVYANEYQYTPAFDENALKNIFASRSPFIKKLKSAKETYVGAFAPTPILGVYITVLQLKKEAFRSIYHTNIILILFLLTIGTLAYFGALTFAEQLGEPIAALSEAANEVSHGNLDVHVEEEIGWGEFKQLISDFNKMTADLKDYQQLQLQAQISEMKENIFRSVAHDLRAPLLGLQGYLFILQSGKVSKKEEKEYLELMGQAAKNLSVLLEDVLDVSRVEAGMMEPHKQRVDVKSLLKQVTDTLAPTAAEKNLTLKCEEEITTVWADPKLLQRVIMNLVSNAIKFTEKGFVKIRAWKKGKTDYLSVEDSGIGLSEQDMKGLFQKYHQVNEGKPGFGLGLFISRQMVVAHGGTLEVASQPGKGSTFTIALPQEEA